MTIASTALALLHHPTQRYHAGSPRQPEVIAGFNRISRLADPIAFHATEFDIGIRVVLCRFDIKIPGHVYVLRNAIAALVKRAKHMRLSDNLYNRLSENPLDRHQTLAPYGDSWLLTCKTRDTQGLRLFLIANAADIEVLEPQALRDHVHALLSAAVKNYEN